MFYLLSEACFLKSIKAFAQPSPGGWPKHQPCLPFFPLPLLYIAVIIRGRCLEFLSVRAVLLPHEEVEVVLQDVPGLWVGVCVCECVKEVQLQDGRRGSRGPTCSRCRSHRFRVRAMEASRRMGHHLASPPHAPSNKQSARGLTDLLVDPIVEPVHAREEGPHQGEAPHDDDHAGRRLPRHGCAVLCGGVCGGWVVNGNGNWMMMRLLVRSAVRMRTTDTIDASTPL